MVRGGSTGMLRVSLYVSVGEQLCLLAIPIAHVFNLFATSVGRVVEGERYCQIDQNAVLLTGVRGPDYDGDCGDETAQPITQ